MRVLGLLVWKEYLHIFRDRATLFQVMAIPVVQLLLLGFAATFEVRQTPVYLVDLDATPASRLLGAHFSASPYFHFAGRSGSIDRAGDALLAGRATMILHVPAGFERDLVRDRSASVQLVLSAAEGATAGIVPAYAAGIIADFARDAGATITPPSPSVARGSDLSREGAPRVGAPRIDMRTRGWYNRSLDYQAYMVPGILVAIVTVIGTLLTAQNIAREKEVGTLEQLNVTPLTRTQFIAGKLIPFWILALLELTAGLALAHFVFAVPMRGSLLLVYGVAAIYLLAALGLGLLISTVAETQQQAMFVTFFVMLIYLLMSGLFTPVSSMPQWVQWLAELNPVKHFVHVMRAVLVRGAGFADIRASVLALTLLAAISVGLAVQRSTARAA
jgi:ABC-2 type transport system permease protein